LDEDTRLVLFENGTSVEVADNESLRSPIFSVEFWAWPAGFNKWSRWMGKSVFTSEVKEGWEVMWTNDADNPSVCLVMWDDGGIERRSPSIGLVLDKWVHVVFVFNGSHLLSFRNGSLEGVTGVDNWEPIVSREPLRIGMAFDGSFYEGYFASLRLYDRALSASEVASNTFGEVSRDGLVLEFYFFDDGSTTLQDLSGKGNDGVIVLGPSN
jgi:hypothetical protein